MVDPPFLSVLPALSLIRAHPPNVNMGFSSGAFQLSSSIDVTMLINSGY